MSEIKRQTAHKCFINQLLSAKYVQQQGLNPNYIDLGKIHAARINIIAILVSKEGNALTIDDGTGQVQVMLFEDKFKHIKNEIGTLLMILGKPREHNDKRFIVPEIIKHLTNRKWMEYRRAELELLDYSKEQEEVITPTNSNQIETEVVENYQNKILIKIKELDKGDGAPYEDLIKALKVKNAAEQIEELIKEGEIFEIKGKLKIL